MGMRLGRLKRLERVANATQIVKDVRNGAVSKNLLELCDGILIVDAILRDKIYSSCVEKPTAGSLFVGLAVRIDHGVLARHL